MFNRVAIFRLYQKAFQYTMFVANVTAQVTKTSDKAF